MKKLIFLLFLFFCSFHISLSQSTWQLVNPPVNADFVSVCFTDESHGWIVSETGTIVWTTDAGMTMSTISFPEYHFKSVHFSDSNHGCIVGWQELPTDSSLILMTSNGGDDWSLGNHEKVNHLNDVFFINNDKGWAVGSRDSYNLNCCLHTLDGGNNWTIQESILVAGAELFGVHFRDENIGQTCGTDGAFFLTNNGGGTGWALGISMPLVNLNDIYNFGSQAGCMVGDAGNVLYTINNWYQYIGQNSGTIENLHGVSGNPATNEVWAVGDNGTIIYTSNYLLGWATQASGVTENLNDVCMINENEGYAVGDNGTILHFTSPVGHREIREGSGIIVYNNLTNNRVAISCPDNTYVNFIQVHALTGEIVYHYSMNQDCIYHEFELSDVNGGLYVLKIDTNMGSKSKKIFLH